MGSGGVGFLVKQCILDHFNVSVLDTAHEGILWLQLASKHDDHKFSVCVCYLPPQGSSRATDPHEFYENLLTQVSIYQKDGPFYICGDFNSRLGENVDYIEGVDDIPPRVALDTRKNGYGDLLCEFLLSANMCVLNGRNGGKDDYTSVSPRGLAVVDYCVIPHEDLDHYQDFVVHRASQLFKDTGCISVYTPSAIPDHSLLQWTYTVSHSYSLPTERKGSTVTSFVKYDRSLASTDFLGSAECTQQIHGMIQRLETVQADVHELDSTYTAFCNVVKQEMDHRLCPKVIKIKSGLSNKRRRTKKAWWSDELTNLWNELCSAEDRWQACRTSTTDKARLKANMREKRQNFDRKVQSAKRKFWRQKQAELVAEQKTDSKSFWRKIGQLGVGSKLESQSPWRLI